MKILGLCVLVLVCLAPLQCQESPKNDQVPAQASPFTAPSPLFGEPQAVPPLFSRYLEPDRIFVGTFSEPYCAYMRTYRVQRERRGSDLVRPAGYTTCVPTKRFEMKSAVEVQDRAR